MECPHAPRWEGKENPSSVHSRISQAHAHGRAGQHLQISVMLEAQIMLASEHWLNQATQALLPPGDFSKWVDCVCARTTKSALTSWPVIV